MALLRMLRRTLQTVNQTKGNRYVLLSNRAGCIGIASARATDCERVTGNLECAGINRHVVANERVVQERSSESILAPNLAVNIVKVLIEA